MPSSFATWSSRCALSAVNHISGYIIRENVHAFHLRGGASARGESRT